MQRKLKDLDKGVETCERHGGGDEELRAVRGTNIVDPEKKRSKSGLVDNEAAVGSAAINAWISEIVVLRGRWDYVPRGLMGLALTGPATSEFRFLRFALNVFQCFLVLCEFF